MHLKSAVPERPSDALVMELRKKCYKGVMPMVESCAPTSSLSCAALLVFFKFQMMCYQTLL